MTTIAPYLLKVILCSGILFFYYHVALRNKVFHQWNRFYLLAAVVLSLVLPLVQVTFLFETTDQSNAAALLRSFQQANNTLEEFVVTGKEVTSPEQWLLLGYGAISFFFFLLLLYSLYRITAIIRSHTVQSLHKVKFVNTFINGTPFSFFHYIFWHQSIPLQSPTGRQIFQHEMAHVEEKHSYDKLFLQVVLLFCWCNPFFWLIRKELHAIHEFIADQRSIDKDDTAAFAAMILLSAYPKHFPALTNPFFQTSIKRRILMLTKIQNPVVSYISRMVALPLLAVIVLAFTVRATESKKAEIEKVSENRPYRSLLQSENSPVSDTLPKQTKEIRSVDVKKDAEKKISKITITYADGSTEKMTGKEAEKSGLINNSGYGNSTVIKEKTAPEKKVQIRKAGEGEKQPLFILDEKEISQEEMNKIDPNTIESINVLKDKHATDKYGEKGRNGVVEIILKKATVPNATGKENNIVIEQE